MTLNLPFRWRILLDRFALSEFSTAFIRVIGFCLIAHGDRLKNEALHLPFSRSTQILTNDFILRV